MADLWLDTETYSECDLKAHGTHRYAEHPSTEIMVAQWALDDGEPLVCDCTGRRWPPHLIALLEDPTVTVWAHTSAFDRTLLRHCWGVDVPIERWRDTMVQALAHGLPGGLDKVGQVMGVAAEEAKDKRGRELIMLFCKPRPKNQALRRATRETHPTEWAEFLEYSRQDIVAMRAIGKLMPRWNYPDNRTELALWHLDQRINDRGFGIDLPLAHAAIAAVEQEQKRLKAATHAATGGMVASPSKRDDLLAHILADYGVQLPDMRADTLRRRIEDPDLPDGVKLLLSLRLEAAKTSTAKYKTAVKTTSPDGRLRNALQFSGAQRTARWAGRMFQPHNTPRPDMTPTDIAFGIEALLEECAGLFFDDVMRLTSNVVRGVIAAAEGRKLVASDLSNIEGRVLAWLAGETWKLTAFSAFDAKQGPDLYVAAYARAFNVDPAAVTKAQRQIGKVMELGLGFEGGVAAFLTFAAVYNMDLEELAAAVYATASPDALWDAKGVWEWACMKKRTLGLPERVYVACEVLKKAWRDAHPAVTTLWSDAKAAVQTAVARPGRAFPIGPHLKARRDGAWLRIRLPSGRYLCYLHPQVDERGEITYFGVNPYTRQWGRTKTYGGKIVENVTQACARDVLAHGMPAAEAAGYPIVLTVHDELLTEPLDDPHYTPDTLSEILAAVPPWAAGLPLAAAGFEAPRYGKH